MINKNCHFDRAAARRRATLGLLDAAGRADSAPRGSVEQIDRRTSANDYRTALSLSVGGDVARLDPCIGTRQAVIR